MSDRRLRDLLEERVADLQPVDLVGDAWDRATSVRRRRRAVAGAAAAVVAVVGTVAVVVSAGDGAEPPHPAGSPGSTVSESGVRAVRAGEYGDAAVWWAPSVAEEADLPGLPGTTLPAEIDLRAPSGAMPVGTRAVAMFQVWAEDPGRVVVVASDDVSYSLDIDRFGPVNDDAGNVFGAVRPDSVSPDGRYAFFVQSARRLEVYDFETGSWSRIDTVYAPYAGWSNDGDAIAVPSGRGQQLFSIDGRRMGYEYPRGQFTPLRPRDEVYGGLALGPLTSRAQAATLAGPVTGVDGRRYRTVEGVAVQSGAGVAVLTFSRSAWSGRWLQCCPVIGWLDAEIVLLQSRWEQARVLAWRVNTADLYRVSDIRGWQPGEESYVASFADPER